MTTLAEGIPQQYIHFLINATNSIPLTCDTVARRDDLIVVQIKDKTLLKYLHVVTFLGVLLAI